MAFAETIRHSDSIEQSLPIQAMITKPVLVPTLALSPEANYLRVGNDLEIKFFDDTVLIRNYFIDPTPLKTVDGIILSVDEITAQLSYPSNPILVATTNIENILGSEPSEAIGTVVAAVEGPIMAETPDGKVRPLQEGDPIYLDDTITTSIDSYVRMALNDGTIFQLGPQSKARLDKYSYDPAAESGEFESFVTVGTFRYISGKISGNNQGQHTLIKTPSAHIGIRGSEIDLQIDDKGATTVLHLSGLISVTSPHYEREQIVYEHGTTVYISSEGTSAFVVSTLTEPQIQEVNQRWDVFSSSELADDMFFHPAEGNKPTDSTPQADSPAQQPDTPTTPNVDAGARNPFAPATKDVNADETIDEPVSSDETLREYSQSSEAQQPSTVTPFAVEAIPADTRSNSDITVNQLTGEPSSHQDDLDFDNSDALLIKEDMILDGDSLLPDAPSSSENDSSTSPEDTLPDEQNPSDANDDKTQPEDSDPVTQDPSSNNNVPVVQNDFVSVNDDTAVTISVASLLENDRDKDGDILQIVEVTNPNSGTVHLENNAEIIFVPIPSFSEGSFNYWVSDGQETIPGQVIVTRNLSPIAFDDTVITSDLAPITITTRQLLANDVDPNHDNLSLLSVSQDSLNGRVEFNNQGDVVFTPYPNLVEAGFGQFTYEVSDEHGLSALASVTITFQKSSAIVTNQAPVAQNDQVEINQREPIKITSQALLDNDSDPESDNLSIIGVRDGINGTITFNNDTGEVIFTPQSTFDRSGQFSYEISDSNGNTDLAIVTVTLINQLPQAKDDGPFDITEQQRLVLTREQLLSNDFDPDGDLLTLSRIIDNLNGTTTLDENGNIIFSRGPNFQGSGEFTYEVTDGKGGFSEARVVITTKLKLPDIEAHTTKNQALILPVATLLADGLTVSEVKNATHGQVKFDQVNNNVIFTPANNFTGPAHFEVVTNTQGTQAIAQVNVTITNTVPVASDDQFSTIIDNALLIAKDTLLANDQDADGDTLTIVDIEPKSNGTVILVNDNVLFTPTAEFEGNASFSYTVADTSGAQASALVTVIIERLANDDNEVATTKNRSVTLPAEALLANDNDSNLTLIAVNSAQQGTVELDNNGNVLFTPTPHFTGEAHFQYTVANAEGKIDNALVTVTVTNTTPIAENDTITMPENQALTISAADLLVNDRDEDPLEELVITAVGSANPVQVELADDEITITPAEQFTGDTQFEYTITDGSGAQATATVTVTVIPAANLPPVITLPNSDTPLIYNIHNEPLPIDTAATVTDLDSPDFADGSLEVVISPQRSVHDVLEIQNQGPIAVSSPTGGEITFNGTSIGSFFTIFSTQVLVVKFNENADTTSTEALLQAITYKNDAITPLTETRTVQMTLSDGDGGTSEVVSRDIEITINNIPPIAADDEVTRPFNTTTTLSVTELLQNDQDINPADILSISEITSADEGVQAKLVGNEVQLFVDALINNQFEKVTFDYKINDGKGGEDSATVTIIPDNVIRGTAGNDNLEGTPQLDILLGEAGEDTLVVNKGSDILLGGEGDDLFLFDPTVANNMHINGHSGIDTLSISGTGNQILDLITNRMLPIEQQIQLQGIEKIDLINHSQGQNQLRLSVEDVLKLSDTNQLTIDGDATSMVNSVLQGWQNEGLDPTGLYNHYIHGEAELLVSVDISNQFIS